MKEMSAAEREANFVPRVCIFGGKAFATYVQAKRIVKFITDVGATVNHDPEIGDLLKVHMTLLKQFFFICWFMFCARFLRHIVQNKDVKHYSYIGTLALGSILGFIFDSYEL